MWSFKVPEDDADQEDDDDYRETVEKLSVLYGEEWRNKFQEDPKDNKYFKKEIPEFLKSERKILTRQSVSKVQQMWK